MTVNDMTALSALAATPLETDIDNLVLSHPQDFRLPRRKNKGSRSISNKQFYDLYEGVCFANQLGYLLNTRVVINPATFGATTPAGAQHVLNIFLHRLRNWLRHHDLPALWVYAWEHPKDVSLHVHLMVHVPAASSSDFRDWVRATSASLGAIRNRVGSKIACEVRSPNDWVGQWIAFRYLCKGIGEAIAGDKAQLLKALDQGLVPFKRVGLSSRLGLSARYLSGFQPNLDLTTPESVWTDRYWKRHKPHTPEFDWAAYDTPADKLE